MNETFSRQNGGKNMDDNKLNREVILRDIAEKLKNQAYIAGISPKTYWNNYYSDEIKACVKWSEINQYLK